MGTTSNIAIITDIHGNYTALKTVLDDIDKSKQVHHIYCLGDLIGIGHQTNEVLELLFSREDISFVMGNHDETVLNILEGKEIDSVGEEKEHHEWIAAQLDKKFIPILKNIPEKQHIDIHGKQFLFVHYHLNQNEVFKPIDRKPTSDKLDELYGSTNDDVICFGHHHIIHHFQSENRLYVNPSALGCTTKPLAPYAIIQIGGFGQINTSFIEVPYDNKAFLQLYNQLHVPAKDTILSIFHGDQHKNLS